MRAVAAAEQAREQPAVALLAATALRLCSAGDHHLRAFPIVAFDDGGNGVGDHDPIIGIGVDHAARLVATLHRVGAPLLDRVELRFRAPVPDEVAAVDRVLQHRLDGRERPDPNQRANWDNAVKVLPAFAEQLGDIVKSGRLVMPSPGSQGDRPASNDLEPVSTVVTTAAEPIRANARVVNASSIARAGTTSDESDPISSARTPSREELAATLTARAERLTRHNLLVQQLARRLEAHGCTLSEDPYDCLASRGDQWALIEVKTLHPRGDDERSRIRDALAQLLYYKQFALPDDCQDVTMIAAFERKPIDQHIEWLRHHSICAVWVLGDRFIASDVGTCGLLSEFAELHAG